MKRKLCISLIIINMLLLFGCSNVQDTSKPITISNDQVKGVLSQIFPEKNATKENTPSDLIRMDKTSNMETMDTMAVDQVFGLNIIRVYNKSSKEIFYIFTKDGEYRTPDNDGGYNYHQITLPSMIVTKLEDFEDYKKKEDLVVDKDNTYFNDYMRIYKVKDNYFKKDINIVSFKDGGISAEVIDMNNTEVKK